MVLFKASLLMHDGSCRRTYPTGSLSPHATKPSTGHTVPMQPKTQCLSTIPFIPFFRQRWSRLLYCSRLSWHANDFRFHTALQRATFRLVSRLSFPLAIQHLTTTSRFAKLQKSIVILHIHDSMKTLFVISFLQDSFLLLKFTEKKVFFPFEKIPSTELLVLSKRLLMLSRRLFLFSEESSLFQ